MRHPACPAEASSELKQLSGEPGLTNSYCCLEGCVHARGGHCPPDLVVVVVVVVVVVACGSVMSDSATPWTVATSPLCLCGLAMRKRRLRELISYPLRDSPGKVLVFWVGGGSLEDVGGEVGGGWE